MSIDVNFSRKTSGAALVRYALEQLPIRHTFGIPGVHNTEIYDELARSQKIRPILVTHEGSGAFIADSISRTSRDEIGCLLIVPAAGMTHAMSGIGEAFLDGIPMLVISGGTRTDIEFGFQLHELDQLRVLDGITKGAWRVETHDQIVPTIFEAFVTAVSGVPGPVFVEIPVNIQLFSAFVGPVPSFRKPRLPVFEDDPLLETAAAMLARADRPGIFVGWGAVDVVDDIAEIAELIGAPVSTTLQGMSAFRGNHVLHTGMGFSQAAVPASENAFKDIDVLLAVGTRFGEIPTGSFGCVVPEHLIHIDIDSGSIGRNFRASVGIVADSRVVVPRLLANLKGHHLDRTGHRTAVGRQIAKDKATYKAEWLRHITDRVNPALFFDELRAQLDDSAIVVVDDGNHTFLAAELFEVRGHRSFISPTDFNCMGYCVPAAIGAKLVNPDRQVVGIVGDGAFLMTGLEIVTATSERTGIAYFVFSDGELSQISQGQKIPYNRKTCTVLGTVRLEGIAMATGARYVAVQNNTEICDGIRTALETIETGQPVIVDVKIDYSKQTRFTQGVVKTVLARFPFGEKVRFIGRAAWRKTTKAQKKAPDRGSNLDPQSGA
ncbi:thiamine pyrophosphate-binding protein [Bacteroidota bacterium]